MTDWLNICHPKKPSSLKAVGTRYFKTFLTAVCAFDMSPGKIMSSIIHCFFTWLNVSQALLANIWIDKRLRFTTKYFITIISWAVCIKTKFFFHYNKAFVWVGIKSFVVRVMSHYLENFHCLYFHILFADMVRRKTFFLPKFSLFLANAKEIWWVSMIFSGEKHHRKKGLTFIVFGNCLIILWAMIHL